MMAWIKPETMEYPYSEKRLRQDNPNTSFVFPVPEWLLNQKGIYTVHPSEEPKYNSLSQRLKEGIPIFENERWIQVRAVEELPIESVIHNYTVALEAYYDQVANIKRYDNRITCSLRAGIPGPFQNEGISFGVWMDSCNAVAYTIMADVMAGTIAMPSFTELKSMLPQPPW